MSGQENQNGERGTIAMVVKDRKGRWDTLVDRGRVVGIRLPAQSQPMFRRRFSAAMVFATLTLVYFVAGKLGLKLAFLQASASPVWPPAGIAVGALLVLGYRTWPAIFVGAFLVNISTTGNIPTSVAIGVGNTLEAIFGAWLVNRFAGGMRVFDHSQNVFKFGFAAVTSAV